MKLRSFRYRRLNHFITLDLPALIYQPGCVFNVENWKHLGKIGVNFVFDFSDQVIEAKGFGF